MAPSRPYHHGDLRPALVAAAVEVVGEGGVAAMSVREVARRAGVTHASATYHFGDRAGLLTAVAVDGYRRLGRALADAEAASGSFLEVGVAYVRFALAHPAHFEVMFLPRLLRRDDPALAEARAVTARALYGTADAGPDDVVAGLAAWSLVHGLATLWLDGNVPPGLGDDPGEVARRVAAHLRTPRA